MSRALLHPIALASIALLLVNDHYLKSEYPSWFTGKLSDVAGLVVFPLVLAALTRMPVAWAAAATAIVFALVKVVPAATDAYRHALGVLQILIGGDGRPVEAVTDPTDLVALPFVLLAISAAGAAADPVDDRALHGGEPRGVGGCRGTTGLAELGE